VMATYLMAEIGSTHDGSLGNCLRAIEVFAGLGANAIKLQDHRVQAISADAEHPPWFNGRPHESRAAYLARTAFDGSAWDKIRSACKSASVDLVVSPFSVYAARALEEIVDAYKVASGQVTNYELLNELVQMGKPVHLSTGMSPWSEIRLAIDLLRPVLRSLMQCASEYPTPPERWPLHEFVVSDEPGQWVAGYSDHSAGILAPLLAVWCGARVVEVHVTLSRELYGSDAKHSLEPWQVLQLVDGIKQVEAARDSTVTRDDRVALLAETRRQFLAT
jgi:sialic acid synthase SpsE